jgi:hypothetical protein
VKIYVNGYDLVTEKMDRIDLDELKELKKKKKKIEFVRRIKYMDCSMYSGDIQLYSADVALFEDGSLIGYYEGEFELLIRLTT